MKSLRPCPRCLMLKADFPNLGLPEDQQQRLKLKRIDNQTRNNLVAEARSKIFTDGRAVNSKGVEQLLKSHSYVPTEVCTQILQLHRTQQTPDYVSQNAFSR